MLRRGPDSDAKHRRRPAGTEDPFHPGAAGDVAMTGTGPLGSWTALASYLDLDATLVSSLARAAMGSPVVATLQSGEIAVGAMLASLAIRGEDVLLEELLAVSSAELRLNRYAIGQLTPLAVHPIATVAELLRCLSWCAASEGQESWEVVANDGQHRPVAIATARHHELRWLQPAAPDDPHVVAWNAPTTDELPPGSTVTWWETELNRPIVPPTAPMAAPPTVPIGSMFDPSGPGPAAPASSPAAPTTSPMASTELLAAVRATVDKSLAGAFIELELEPDALAELRDTSVLERLIESVVRLEQRLQQVEHTNRQVQELTTGVEELTEAARALMRHQWDNMPPQNFWVRVQKADDELRRSVDDLTAEVRSRLPKPKR